MNPDDPTKTPPKYSSSYPDPTVPPPNAPKQPPFKFDPLKAVPLITVGIILILLVQLGIVFLSKPNEPSPTSKIRRTDIVPIAPNQTGWKAYTHPEHKYSISYPPEWHLFPNAVVEVGNSDTRKTVITTAERMDPGRAIIVKSPDSAIAIGVQSVNKDPKMSLREYDSKVVRNGDKPNYSETEIGGHPALRQDAGRANEMEFVYYLVDGGSIVYEISINAVKTADKVTARDILRTIQFLL